MYLHQILSVKGDPNAFVVIVQPSPFFRRPRGERRSDYGGWHTPHRPSSRSEMKKADQNRERWSGSRRGNSFEKDPIFCSPRNFLPDAEVGDRRVYVSWNQIVSDEFLYKHFKQFGEVENIWVAHGRVLYGFVLFVKEEVGRSLLGAVQRVAGVELLINKAEPELVRWKTGEVISLRPAARLCESRGFSRQELYLRGGDSDFRHTGKQKIGQDGGVEDTEGVGIMKSP